MMAESEQSQAHAEPQASVRVPSSFPCYGAFLYEGLGGSKLGTGVNS